MIAGSFIGDLSACEPADQRTDQISDRKASRKGIGIPIRICIDGYRAVENILADMQRGSDDPGKYKKTVEQARRLIYVSFFIS